VLTFKRSGSSCCLRTTRTVRASLADGPRGGFQPTVRQGFRVFSFGRVLLVAQGLADSPRGEAGQSVRREQSVFRGAVLEVWEAISDSPQ
jgi:hypothetical protein